MNALKTLLLCGISTAIFTSAASAQDFNIPSGDLRGALSTYMKQSGVTLMFPSEAVKGIPTDGAHGQLSPDAALSRILDGTGFAISKDSSGVIAIVRKEQSAVDLPPMQLAQAAPARAAVETVTVTSSKLGGADVQSIPIAITALSQEQLTATQTAGGPDLVKQVPNLTFTKTNFSGYSIQIRGIGTQAISVTTDPAVAVAFNDAPFIRNHFFEQEFFDVAQVAVLRGPQGTLYGRNATAGVVNLTSARPTDQFEAIASAEFGNYHQRRFEGMINLPIVDDRAGIRVAGEWTKRQGYSFNALTDDRIDGRDLWSGRVTLGVKPVPDLQAYLIWEHFSESDDRIRSSKQLCKTDPGPSEVNGVSVSQNGGVFSIGPSYLSQGCLPASFYSSESFEVPNGYSLPYWSGPNFESIMTGVNPYAGTRQSRNLRVIESTIDPHYKAKNDIVELNVEYRAGPALAFVSQTAFGNDFLRSTQDYNRFNTAPGVFNVNRELISADGVFCDPQLGCSDRLVAQDLSTEHAWQLSQEFRVASNFEGPINFSLGGNYLHYETEENYYVFINSLTAYAASFGYVDPHTNEFIAIPWVPGVTDHHECLVPGTRVGSLGYQYPDPSLGGGVGNFNCIYIDPNPFNQVNDKGHNYFLSQNPYTLNSYAAFGEIDYKLTNDLKLTGGLRWTRDEKHFPLIPSWLLGQGYGYPIAGVVDQQWSKITGRFVANWTPKLDFTDQTLVYGSFARGYKAGGANPPGAVLLVSGYGEEDPNPIHPLSFEPEYINAFEIGTKNTLFDGELTFNASSFYYKYKGYQISEIIDRTSINRNFDADIKGAEVEATWEPMPGLRFNFAGGWEDTSLAKGSRSVDLIDRTAGNTDWMVVKPFATQSSNCILPKYVVAAALEAFGSGQGSPAVLLCGNAYQGHLDPVTLGTYHSSWEGPDDPANNLAHGQPYYLADNSGTITTGGYPYAITTLDGGTTLYPGFDPSTAPNNGAGFFKDLSGNELPNAPPYTVSIGAQYSIPLTSEWAGTLRGDFYWQDNSWARVFNDDPYDRIHGYTNLNLTLILTSQSGWQVMLFDKNVFNTTAITGAFLNSDDSGLTTNVFLTDPKLIGVRVTKNW